jgi:Domain of unknown function (DUF6532)
MNPAIIQTLKRGFFSSQSSIANRHVEHFPQAVAGENQQMSIALLSLVATGVRRLCPSRKTHHTHPHKVHYGLYQYQEGSSEDDLPFSGNIFGAVYNSHAAALTKMATKTPNKFMRIMSTLFELAGYVLALRL